MGVYINDLAGADKTEWLITHGVKVDKPYWVEAEMLEALPVCLVSNTRFYAAAICYSPQELYAFAVPDGRVKLWFYVDIDLLCTVSNLAGYLGRS